MKSFAARTCTAAVGGLLIAGVALAASAETQVGSDEGVDVNVSIAQIGQPGVLAMTVADDQVTLAETTSADPTLRQFEGTLPEVTVTDTRTADETPEGAFWYVVGQASDFTGSAGTIPAANLGWLPALTSDDGNGSVMEGDEVLTALDADPGNGSNVGLVDKELLALNIDAVEAAEANASYSAEAALLLKTPISQAAGDYSSVLTLSLWEDVA